VLVVASALQAGCATQRIAQLRADPYSPLSERLKLTARGGPRPSARTAQLLRQYDLAFGIGGDPRKALATLTKQHEEQPHHDTSYALAELSFIAGKKRELEDRRSALGYYWNCVVHSYAYLFDPQFDFQRNPYDPQFRGACDLYNGALENCLRIAQKEGFFKPGRTVTFTMAGRSLDVSIVPQEFQWSPQDFDHFEFASDYEVTGLTNQYRTYGLGVPLIAVRKGASAPKQIEKYYAEGLSFPVTAFLRIDGSGGVDTVSSADAGGNRTAVLELHDPLKTSDVVAGGTRVPLESDLSTPLAYFLDNPALQHLDTYGLLWPGKAQRIAGLYMIQPYQPGKIPVLMVHGLWSSPMAWMEMFNDLRSMPDIRDKYQFWFYLYPTGKPFWETAADLREDLAELRTVFDPQRQEPALDNMVIVGHSMGGLIGRLLTLESGDRYWGAVSETPFPAVQASYETKQRFERVFFFEPNRSVGRVVMIASPHRGSKLANRATQWLFRQLVSLPRKTIDGTRQLLAQNPGLARGEESRILNTSVDSLSPESPILLAMHQTSPAPWVKYHNIVGIVDDAPLEKNGDGVVGYASAHLEGADSEIVVAAGHNEIHRHPLSVLEVRRVLLEHLREYAAKANPIRQLGVEQEPPFAAPRAKKTALSGWPGLEALRSPGP
jgi:pimeloyl-ACP methyl ester carboxylesterase